MQRMRLARNHVTAEAELSLFSGVIRL